MFWNEMTVNTLIMVYILGLFILILVCLYALIQSKANKLYTFIIIPLALIMASMTWQGIKLLQGMPVYGLPENQEVEVMWVNDNKPWIYAVLKIDKEPVLFKIDWSEENKKKMKELEQAIGSSLAQGKFKIKRNKGESESYHFTPMQDLSEPEEKRRDDGVTFQPAETNNSSVLDYVGEETRIERPGDFRPSLRTIVTVVDGDPVIFERSPVRELYTGSEHNAGGK